jgi:hypothetical protein
MELNVQSKGTNLQDILEQLHIQAKEIQNRKIE